MTNIPSGGSSPGHGPLSERTFHLLAPGFSNSITGGGGTSLFRGIAIAVAKLARTICYEVSRGAPVRWQPCGIEVISASTVDDALTALAHKITSGSVIIKTSNSFGKDGYQADAAVASLAMRDGTIRVIYVDGDAPFRLPYMLRHDFYLNRLLSSFHGIVIFGGGPRAVAEYRHLTPVPILHLSGSLLVLGLLTEQCHGFQAEHDYDLLVTVASASRREARVGKLLAGLIRQRPLRIAVVGDWRNDELGAGVTLLPPCDALDLLTFYARSRFTLNALRPQMLNYSHTTACRVFEAVVSGSCVVTEPFSGLESILTPGAQCLVARDIKTLSASLEVPETRRAVIIRNARRHVRRHCVAEFQQFEAFLNQVVLSEGHRSSFDCIIPDALNILRQGRGCVGTLPDLDPASVRRLRAALHPAVHLVPVRILSDLLQLNCWGIAVSQASKELVDDVLASARTTVKAVFVEVRDEARWPAWLSGRDWRIEALPIHADTT